VTPEGGRFLWFITVFYPVMAAIRLARYNVEHSDGEEGGSDFRGLPSPGAAAVLCGLIAFQQCHGALFGSAVSMVGYHSMFESFDPLRWLIVAATLLCALLMVSTVRYPHAGAALLGRMHFRKFILLSVVVAVLVWQPWWTLMIVTSGYMLYGMAGEGVAAWKRWRRGRNPLIDEDEEAAEDAGALEPRRDP
jgi:CDP-diacylglycerol--serine O-phosphatidyltransferase